MTRMTKTSQSNPLRIAELPCHAGMIGMSLCPGKIQAGGLSGDHQRDLQADVEAIARWGAHVVVTLIEDHEFRLLQVQALPDTVRGADMDWLHLPNVDQCAPDQRFHAAWQGAGPHLHDQLRAGRKILLHCMGGLGRTGTVAAQLLIESGDTDDVIERVRRARPGAIETEAQQRYLLAKL